MSDTALNQTASCVTFSEEQRKFLKVLFKRSKARLSASLKKSQRESRTSVFNQLNQTLLEVCADIIKKSETPQSCLEKLMSCGGGGDVQFVDVVEGMQEKGLIEAMMQEADPKVAEITTNPQLEMKKFIDEVFVIMDKFTEAKKEEPEAPTQEQAPAEEVPAEE